MEHNFSELKNSGTLAKKFISYLYKKTGGRAQNPQSDENIIKALELVEAQDEYNTIKDWLKNNNYIYERANQYILSDIGLNYIFSEKSSQKSSNMEQL